MQILQVQILNIKVNKTFSKKNNLLIDEWPISLVLEYNVLCASSVPSESLFSEAGYINNKYRASMHPTTLKHCMVVKHAQPFLCDDSLQF